jgi:hypothetical protein
MMMSHHSLLTWRVLFKLLYVRWRHTEGIDADEKVTNERIGVSEATQLATDTKLGTMESSVACIDNNLAALLRRFDDLMTREHDRH